MQEEIIYKRLRLKYAYKGKQEELVSEVLKEEGLEIVALRDLLKERVVIKHDTCSTSEGTESIYFFYIGEGRLWVCNYSDTYRSRAYYSFDDCINSLKKLRKIATEELDRLISERDKDNE